MQFLLKCRLALVCLVLMSALGAAATPGPVNQADQRIEEKWHGADIAGGHLLANLGYGAIAALLLILALVSWNRTLSRMVDRRTMELKASESRLRAILQAVPESVEIISPDGRLLAMNPAGLAILEASTLAEAQQRPLLEYVAPEHREAFKDHHRKVLRGEDRRLEFEMESLRGTRRWLEIHATALRDEAGRTTALLGITQNITERKQVEALTAGQVRVLEMIAAGAPLSETLTVLLSVVEAQSPGMLCSILLLDPDGVHVRHGAAPSLPREFIQSIDGSAIGPSAGSCGTAAFRRERVLVADIAADPLWTDYRHFALPHGLRACWSTPIFDPQNKVLGTFAIYYREPGLPRQRDLQLIDAASHTAAICINRHRTEQALRESEERFRQSQKMEAIGTLAGGIAHDFNNVLSAISGNAELALQDVGPEHAAYQSLGEILKAGNRAKNLVQQIMTFTRSQQPERSVIALGPLVEETAGFLRVALPSTVELAVSLAEDAPNILANTTQIQQALLNILTNAWHALAGQRGRIEVQLCRSTLDAGLANIHSGLRAGDYACLSVRDTGKGMDEATRARIFEPFFTTKPEGQGTGLGLTVAHGIVNSHEGAIVVASNVHGGTTFELYFPAVSAAVAESSAAPQAEVSRGDGQHLLYIDDEEALVILTTRVFERAGYAVSGFTDASKALDMFRANPDQFDLAVTDFNMPGTSGLDVAAELMSIRPDMSVVLTSGYVTDDLKARASRAGIRHVIYKPNSVKELCDAVQQVLREQEKL